MSTSSRKISDSLQKSHAKEARVLQIKIDSDKLIALIKLYQARPNFIKEGDCPTHLHQFVETLTKDAYAYFQIQNLYNINKLMAKNGKIKTNLESLTVAMNCLKIDPTIEPRFIKKIEEWQKAIEELRTRNSQLDRSELLDNIVAKSESFERDLMSAWLEAVSNSNVYKLRSILFETASNSDIKNIPALKAIAETPVTQLTEKELVSFINDTFKSKHPEQFYYMLHTKIENAGLLEKNIFSADEVNTKMLKALQGPLDATREKEKISLGKRVSTDMEVAYDKFNTDSDILIDDINDLLRTIQPLAIQNATKEINANHAEIMQLWEDMKKLKLALEEDLALEENAAELEKRSQSIESMRTALKSSEKELNRLGDWPELHVHLSKMKNEYAQIHASFLDAREINRARGEKIPTVKEHPTHFLNALNVVDVARETLKKNPEIDILSINAELQKVRASMEEARDAVESMQDIRKGLEMSKDKSKKELPEARLQSFQDKLAITAVIAEVLDNLGAVLEGKAPKWHTSGMQSKLNNIEAARTRAVENMGLIVDAIYTSLKSNPPEPGLDKLLQHISNGFLKFGDASIKAAKPSIEAALNKERLSLGKSHLSSKLQDLNKEMLKDNQELKNNLRALDNSLGKMREMSAERQVTRGFSMRGANG